MSTSNSPKDYIDLKWSNIDYFTGAGEEIEICDNERTCIFLYVSDKGIHVCDLNKGEKGKMELIPRKDATKMKIRLAKKDSNSAKDYQGKCLLGWQFSEKLEEIRKIFEEHEGISKGEETFGSVVIPVLWAKSDAPSSIIVHEFTDYLYMKKTKALIAQELEKLGIPYSIETY